MSPYMHFMRTRQPRLTLGQFIALCFAGLALLLLVLLSIFYSGSRRTILLASRQVMSQASRRINERLDGHLGEAERVVASSIPAGPRRSRRRSSASSPATHALPR